MGKKSFIKLIKLKIVTFTSTLDEKTFGGMTKGLEMMTPLKYSGFFRVANKAAAPPLEYIRQKNENKISVSLSHARAFREIVMESGNIEKRVLFIF